MWSPLARRDARVRRDAIADAVDHLQHAATTHRDGPHEAIRRRVLRRAAYDLDATIGRHAQRRADRARDPRVATS